MPSPITLEFSFRNKRFRDAERGLRAFSKSLGSSITRSFPVVSKEMRKTLEGVAKALAQRHGTDWPGGTTAKSLSKRSGRGVESILSSVEVKGSKLDSIEGRIGGVGYLSIHETGGVIRARRAKYLTIPLRAALNSNGTPIKKSAREWSNTFVATSKKGNLLIFQRKGRDIVPLYVLKKSVKIPPRLQMQKTIEAAVPFFVDRVIDSVVKELAGR